MLFLEDLIEFNMVNYDDIDYYDSCYQTFEDEIDYDADEVIKNVIINAPNFF